MKTYRIPRVRVHKVNVEPLMTQSWNPGKGDGGYTHPEKPGHGNGPHLADYEEN